MKRRFKTAFILGAGLGKRLLPLTEKCPKPLLEINGRPIITYALDHLLSVDIERFVINIHYLPESYYKIFPKRQWRGVPIFFRYEPTLLETGGGLKNIEDILHTDEAIICYNGDALSDLPLKKLLEFHNSHRPEATLALRSHGSLLNVEIDQDGTICDLRNQLGVIGLQTCQFTGIYTIETSLLKYIEPNKSISIISIFHELNLASEYCDKIMLLDKGEIKMFGNCNEVMDYKIIEEVYKTTVVITNNPISKKPYIFPVPFMWKNK